jgi:hypothetical protein
MVKKKKKELPMIWQRGYRCHTLWQGNECVGRIELGAAESWDEIYRCQAGTVLGEAKILVEAKRWVQETARLSKIQHRLF